MITDKSETVQNSAKYQYLVTFCGNLMIICYGACAVWPSTSFDTLQSDQSPLPKGPLTTDEISWFVSCFCIGGLLGTVLFGTIVNVVGRKTYCCLLAVPMIVSWVLIVLATDVTHLYVSRLLCGATGGASYIFLPLLIAEVSEDRVRGSLGTIITVSNNLGVLLCFVADNCIGSFTIPYVMMCIPMVFLALFVWFPESPNYLMLNNEPKKAETSLKLYRNCRRESNANSDFFQNELSKFRALWSIKAEDKVASKKLGISDFLTRPALMAFLISIMIFTMSVGCGTFTLMSYTSTIFGESGSSIPPEWSAIVVATFQLAGTYSSTILIDRLGRRPLLIFSSLGGFLGLVGLGTYLYLNQLGGWDLTMFNWVPVVTFSVIVFVPACGTVPISYVIMTEIMPPNIRSVGTSICLGYCWSILLIMVKFFPLISEAYGLHVCIAFFAICTLGGMLFVIFVMPETKGKSFEDIQRELQNANDTAV